MFLFSFISVETKETRTQETFLNIQNKLLVDEGGYVYINDIIKRKINSLK